MRRVDHSARSRSDGNGGEGEKKKLAFVSRRMLVLRVSWGCVKLTQSLRGERKMNELGKWRRRRRYTRRVISGEYGLGKRRLIAVDGGKIRDFFLGKNAPETRVSLGNSGGQVIRGRYASRGSAWTETVGWLVWWWCCTRSVPSVPNEARRELCITPIGT